MSSCVEKPTHPTKLPPTHWRINLKNYFLSNAVNHPPMRTVQSRYGISVEGRSCYYIPTCLAVTLHSSSRELQLAWDPSHLGRRFCYSVTRSHYLALLLQKSIESIRSSTFPFSWVQSNVTTHAFRHRAFSESIKVIYGFPHFLSSILIDLFFVPLWGNFDPLDYGRAAACVAVVDPNLLIYLSAVNCCIVRNELTLVHYCQM